MSTWRRIRIASWRAGVPLLIAALAWLGPCSAGASISFQDDSARPLVIDRAGILDEGQERSAVNDAYRLNLYGIPTQIVTEPVGLNQPQADARANELRESQGIESHPGANDGLLFYVSTDLYDPSNIVMSISVGARTLPRNGFTAAALDDIRTRIVAVQLAFGHPARAIVYSLREMIYLEQYVPPPPPPLTGWRFDANPIVDVAGPIVAATGGAWLFWRVRSHHAPVGIAPRRTLAPIALVALVVGLIVFAVATRSEAGALSAVVLGGLVIWHAVVWERAPSRDGPRAIKVSPRRPGSRHPVRIRRIPAQ